MLTVNKPPRLPLHRLIDQKLGSPIGVETPRRSTDWPRHRHWTSNRSRMSVTRSVLSASVFRQAQADPRSRPARRDFESEPGSIFRLARFGIGACQLPGSLLFYFCQLYRASSCWYFCWYRQQSTKKITLHSEGYGSGRVSARGTILKTSTITMI
jgi:hypothetical protein